MLFLCPQMRAVTASRVVFINREEESAFHAIQLHLLLYLHLSIYCYLLKHVQRALLSSDTVSQQAHLPIIKLSTPTVNKVQPTPLNVAIEIALMA